MRLSCPFTWAKFWVLQQMYQGAMQAIRDSLVHKGTAQGLTFTAELLPQRQTDGQMCVRSPCAKASDPFPDAFPP